MNWWGFLFLGSSQLNFVSFSYLVMIVNFTSKFHGDDDSYLILKCWMNLEDCTHDFIFPFKTFFDVY